MSALNLRVLISGAGIAGPCCAYWLARARHNIAITIVERSPSPRLTGQSIDIHGLAIEIVKRMRLEEAIRSRHTTEQGTSFVRSNGKTFAQFKAGETFTAEYEILRADLSQLFLEATENLGNVQYMYGDSVKTLEQTEKGVNVVFGSGSTATYDVLIAADGSMSKTRSMFLDESILKDSYNFLGQYLAFFSIPSLPTDPKMWQWYNTQKGLCIMTRPHRTPATTGAYLCVTTPARGVRDQAIEDVMDKGVNEKKRILREYFENAGWQAKRVLDGMDQADDFYMSRAAQVKLPKWTNNRAVVLGDAAFATFGIGTTLAIESAYVLAGELSKIQSSDEVPQALERYEQVFRPIYAKMEELPPFFPQAVFPQTALGLGLRDALLWLVSKTGMYGIFQGGSREEFNLPSYDWVDI